MSVELNIRYKKLREAANEHYERLHKALSDAEAHVDISQQFSKEVYPEDQDTLKLLERTISMALKLVGELKKK